MNDNFLKETNSSKKLGDVQEYKEKKSLEEQDSISNSEITPLENTEEKFFSSKTIPIDFYQIHPRHFYLAYKVIQFFKKHEFIAMYIGPVLNLLMSSIMFSVIFNSTVNTISIYFIIFFAFNVLSFVIRCLLNFNNLKHYVNYYNLSAAILKLAFIVTLRIILGINYPTYKNILGESLLLLSMMFLFVFFAPIAKYETNTTIMISSFVCYLSLMVTFFVYFSYDLVFILYLVSQLINLFVYLVNYFTYDDYFFMIDHLHFSGLYYLYVLSLIFNNSLISNYRGN